MMMSDDLGIGKATKVNTYMLNKVVPTSTAQRRHNRQSSTDYMIHVHVIRSIQSYQYAS